MLLTIIAGNTLEHAFVVMGYQGIATLERLRFMATNATADE
jgi:hypothetical protein